LGEGVANFIFGVPIIYIVGTKCSRRTHRKSGKTNGRFPTAGTAFHMILVDTLAVGAFPTHGVLVSI
jgi:hypothetical protein